MADDTRMIESTIDESAIWQGTQTVSQVLAIFRERYAPKSGSPIIDSGDPRDDDSLGRRSDIGAIDVAGHDQDHFGKFGSTPPSVAPSDGGSGGMGGASSAMGGHSGATSRDSGVIDGGSGPTHDSGARGGKPASDASNGSDAAAASAPDARANDLRGSCDCSLIGRRRTGSDQRAASAILLALLFSARPLRRLRAAKRRTAR
jgi:hypothetical protein